MNVYKLPIMNLKPELLMKMNKPRLRNILRSLSIWKATRCCECCGELLTKEDREDYAAFESQAKVVRKVMWDKGYHKRNRK